MIEFQKPTISTVEESENYGKFVAEPLERGYGTTLGNSLRRVLLSGLPGAAINSVQIDGVLHEFTTIDGVTEDVTQIILNLKKVAMRIDSDEQKTLEVDFSGAGELTAGDIKSDGDVEILNPDLHIATVSAGKSLHMALTAVRGRGYDSA
ncbi:DNA-directed RNA polymerase subunit alpha, partial [Oenococcus oeni]